MTYQSALARLGTLIKAKRREKDIGLRSAASECEISPSTLSRLERGVSSSLPDADTLTKLATWLEVSVDYLLSGQEEENKDNAPELTTPEIVEVHLRADKRLSPETAEALAELFRIAYKQFTRKQPN